MTIATTSRLYGYLDEHSVGYERIEHRTDYSAQKTAADTHVSGWEFAKVVVLDVPSGRVMGVLAAPEKIDLEHLRTALDVPWVALTKEEDLREIFPDCDLGAEPPFGNLYDMPVYVSPALQRNEWITMNGGRHDLAVRLRYADYAKLVQPRVVHLSFGD